MKLKVYQQGGGLIYTPFIPGQQTTGTSSSSKEDDDAKIDPLDKEILGLLKDANLLPSDIAIITNALMSFQRRTQRLSSMGISGGYRSVMPGMLQIMNQVAIGKHNKEVWKDRVQEMQKHDAGSEVAMDSYGNIWTKSEEGIKKIMVSDFDPEKHTPMSVSQMLFQRERNLGFADDIIGETGLDIIGAKDLRQEIDAIINEFGTVKSEQYITKDMRELASDIKEKGVFKVTQERSKADLQDFSTLLYLQLGDSSKHLLNARAKINGYDPIEYLKSIIFSNVDISYGQSFDKSLSEVANGKSSTGSGDPLTKDTYAERLNTGEGFEPAQWTSIQPTNSDVRIYAYTQNVGRVLKEGKGFDMANLAEVLNHADALGGIVDTSNIQFGDQLLSSADFSKVVYNNDSVMKRVWLPVKQRADGHIVIDFEAQQKIGPLQEYLSKNGDAAIPYIKEKLEEIDGAYYDEKEKIIKFENSRPFLAIDGIVSSSKVNIDTDSVYIRQMDKGEGNLRKEYKELYNKIINSGYASSKEDEKARYDNGKSWSRRLYEGIIYMPLIGSTIAAGIYNDQFFPKTSYMDITQKATTSQLAQSIKTNFDYVDE